MSVIFSAVRNRLAARRNYIASLAKRLYSQDDCDGEKRGLILGVYEGENNEPVLTKAAQKYNDCNGGKLLELLARSGKLIKKGKGRVFNNIDNDFWSVAVVGLGNECLRYNELEAIDEGLESVRVAAAVGAQQLRKEGVGRIFIEGLGSPEQAAEGSALALWRYQENKSKKYWKVIPTLELYEDPDAEAFTRGLFKAESQNLARRLCDTPANLMTPLHFAQETVNELCPCGVKVEVNDKDWIELKKMNAFLTVARGSCEPPIFLDITYCGADESEKPILLVGQGMTFDSGGLCLKKCQRMTRHRANMTGAATVIAAIRAAAALSLPINVSGCIPLCENMPSGMAMKCGDVVMGMNGKSIMIQDTDNEGRVALTDALVYGQQTHKPKLVVDIASSSKGIVTALGSSASAVYSNSETMWSQLRKAGIITGDRVWRMPLWKFYTRKVTDYPAIDVNNMGYGKGSPCLCAAFLNEFIECVDWMHIDVSGTGLQSEDKVYPYLTQGFMTGRPTRTIIQFLYQLACPAEGKRKIK